MIDASVLLFLVLSVTSDLPHGTNTLTAHQIEDRRDLVRGHFFCTQMQNSSIFLLNIS